MKIVISWLNPYDPDGFSKCLHGLVPSPSTQVYAMLVLELVVHSVPGGKMLWKFPLPFHYVYSYVKLY